jgi:putative lipoic acid-binding regulatory protein
MSEAPLLQFPCEFPIKALGLAEPDFDVLVVSLVRRHAPNLAEAAVRTRASSGGKYLGVTVIVQATSQDQIDRIYHDLSAEDRVLTLL